MMSPACTAVRKSPDLAGLQHLPRRAIELGIVQILAGEGRPSGKVSSLLNPVGRLLVGTGGTPRRQADWLLEVGRQWQDRTSTAARETPRGSPLRLTRCDGRQLAKELRRCREDGTLDPLRKLLVFGPNLRNPRERHRKQPAENAAKATAILVHRIDQAASPRNNQLLLCQLLDAILQTPTLLAVTLPEHPACLSLHPSLESRLTGGLLVPLQRAEPADGQARPERPPSVRRIIAAVARYYAIRPADILGGSQRRCHVRPRGLAIHCLRLLTGQSTHAIGHACGGRDHTTILHSLRVTARLLRTDPALAGDLQAILESLRPRSADLSDSC